MPIQPVTQPLDHPIRLGALISGSGTTLANLVRKIGDGELQAEIAIVIASRDCPGVELAKKAGLRVEIVNRKSCSNVAPFSEAIFEHIRDARVELVVFAGFLSMVRIPDDYRYRVMNIHPALIPAFCGPGYYGHRVHEAALKRGAKISGCTVHFADDEYDHGPIILQKTVPVLRGDTPSTLAARVFDAECAAYPEAISLFATGQLEIGDDQIVHVSA